MNENKIFIIIGVVTAILLFGVVFFASKTNSSAIVTASGEAKVIAKSVNYDWGKIGINNGKAEAVFDVENGGTSDLKLFNVTTSCACTTAQLITKKIQSPLFGMHTKSDFVIDISPGETAKLKVVFDPLFHGPNGLGPVTREITVATNDAANPKLVFSLSADVIK